MLSDGASCKAREGGRRKVTDTAEEKKPKVRIHEPTGLSYLQGSKRVIFENGVLIEREEFEKRKEADITDYLRERMEDPATNNFDFAFACSTGKIRRRRGFGTGRKHTKKKPVIDMEAIIEMDDGRPNGILAGRHENQITEEELDHLIASAKRRNYFSSASIMAVVMAVVGFGSAIMSAYHTTAFLTLSGKPFWASLMTGIMLIIFSATAFTAGLYFFKEGGAASIIGVIFVLLGLGVISFSIFSTITVNFNQFKWEEQKEREVILESSTELAVAGEIREATRAELDRIDAELDRLHEEAEGWRNQSWRRYDDFTARINELSSQRERLLDTYISSTTARLTAESHIISDRGTIYSFLAGLFSVREDFLRFLIYTAPSIFYDICAPFALTVVLALLDKRRKKAATPLEK